MMNDIMGDSALQKGMITKGVGGLYEVRPSQPSEKDTVYVCRARGVFRHDGLTPLPGDIVTVMPDGGEGDEGVIVSIDERKNSLIRPALANLTHLFEVLPAARPAPDLVTADKLICTAEDKGIEPVIIVTKADLDADSAERIAGIYRKSGFSVFCVSADGSGDAPLRDYIKAAASEHMTAAFAGASGAGKSTLMTRLFPTLSLKTGDVSRKIQRGRHTTRHAELYPVELDGARCYIADTPGFSMIDYTRYDFVTEEQLPYTFREFAEVMGQCRYTKCTHTKEEGCAVLQRLKDGDIAAERHNSYLAILEEIKKNPPWKRRQNT